MIQTRALRYQYPRGTLLSFPDIDLPQGSTLLLQGRSGAGKSTWLALAAGLLAPSAGEIIVAGQSLGVLSRAERDHWRGRHVGFLQQKLHLSEALTVHGNLALAYYAVGAARDEARIESVLQGLGVGELVHRRPGQLSGGQAQRVALARALLMRPQVILADEPTASLDDDAARDSLRLLQEGAREQGATLVIATHDVRVSQALPHAVVYRLGASEALAA